MSKIAIRTMGLYLVGLLACAACARAQEGDAVGDYRLELLSEWNTLPIWHHSGRAWVEGREGERYTIRIYNHSSRRVEAVVSVDGRDVIDGGPASLSKRGYVIPPWSSIDIDGFRLNWNEVAAFRFTDARKSYAVRMGSPWAVGVVAVALFPEKTFYRPWPPRPLKTPRGGCYDCESPPSEAAPRSRQQDLGTQFAEPRYSPASETSFVRENFHRPAARLAIYYDDRQGLCDKGVTAACPPWWPPPPPPYVPPEPWPPYQPPRQFAEPPPGWEHFSSWF
jgi:hypothetical protein